MDMTMTKPEPPEIIVVDADMHEVSCDGGSEISGGALGHPKVWYSFDGSDNVECKYCDRMFVLEGSEAAKAVSGKKKKAS